MGMASSDDEREIMRQRSAEEDYRRLYPHRVPMEGASETEEAFYREEVRRWRERDPSR